jgi:signal transduction histidine kinase
LPAGDPKRAVLDEVLSQVERMDKAVRNLLSFARPPEPRLSPVDVNELVGKLLDFLAPQFAKHGITVERRLAAGLPTLTLDPDLVQQAFLNISLNAIQAMAGGGRFTAETLTEQRPGEAAGNVKILFSDTGPGITMEDLGRIFSPFFTTRQQGTGLGLSITQRIIEQHNGDITVSSRPGSGAAFTITLPCRAERDVTEPGSPKNVAENTGH